MELRSKALLLLLTVSLCLVAIGCREQTAKSKPIEKWPAVEIRNEAGKTTPSGIRAIVFPQLRMKGCRKYVRVTDRKLIREFWGGLKEAVWPCDPKALPGNRIEEVYLELKSGKQLGPFSFGTEGWKHAFSRRFAKAYNKVSPQAKIPL